MNVQQSIFAHDDNLAVNLLSDFFGDRAVRVYIEHGSSLANIVAAARDSRDPGMRTLAQAVAIAEAAAIEQAAERDALDSPDAIRQFLQLRFAGQSYESFVVLFLDTHNRLLAAEEAFRGTLGQTAVYPREIVRRALRHNAASIICSHCHPSGVCEPSRADQFLTDTLIAVLRNIDVRVLDHIIIAGGRWMSFAQNGLI